MNASAFLIDTLFNLYVMVVLLRLWLQMARADFYNPLSQFTVKATQPILAPMRRLIPSIGKFDTATFVLALLVFALKIAVLNALFSPNFPTVLQFTVGSLIGVVSEFLSLVFFVLIVRAILSWISQGNNPIEYVFMQLTEPFLAPIRRVVPPLGGLDLSILIAIIGLQFLRLLIQDLTGIAI